MTRATSLDRDVTEGEYWTPTMMLRFVKPDYCFAVLKDFDQIRIEQCWISESGEIAWRAIPHVTESEAAK